MEQEIDQQHVGLCADGWTYLRTNDPRPLDGHTIQGFFSKSYIREVGDLTFTMGIYFLHDKEIYRAWMVKDALSCSFHTVMTSSGMSDPMEGCVPYMVERNNDGSGTLSIVTPRERVRYTITFV